MEIESFLNLSFFGTIVVTNADHCSPAQVNFPDD